MNKSLRIACDGEAASGKSTGAKLISKKYKLFLINSGLLYRYASKIIIKHKPKKIVPFLKKKFKKISIEPTPRQIAAIKSATQAIYAPDLRHALDKLGIAVERDRAMQKFKK